VSGASIQLISYIAPAAPATRRPAEGKEPFLRPEIGFTPKWYRAALGIDFGERWHTEPAYRRETVIAMRNELRRRFPDTKIGGIDRPDRPLDLLTGTYGACLVAGIHRVPIVYAPDNWPNCKHQYLGDEQLEKLTPPELEASPLFRDLMRQVDWIARGEGRVLGYVNWQGILNNAQRLRGQQLFIDLIEEPERCRHLFDCIATTMEDGIKALHARQRASGFDPRFVTVSNCLVNMISSKTYRDLLLPFDQRLERVYGSIGIHNCAWNADPYIDHYATVPNLGYIDMGMDSDLPRAKNAFPEARRGIMYTPMDVANKPLDEIRADFERITRAYGPCDLVLADIEAGTPDEKVLALVEMCREIRRTRSARS